MNRSIATCSTPRNLSSAMVRAWVWAVLALASLLSADAGAEVLSSKRGFADVNANYNNLQATGAGWYYTWDRNPTNSSFGADFYPMFKHGFDVTTGNVNTAISRNPKYVLGFNEPERSSQGNTTVAQAVAVWDNLYDPLHAAGISVVSPAVSDDGAGQTWLSQFMAQKSSKVDAVAFHWYGVSTPNDPIGAANSFISRVDSYHNSYNRPVWITEFAIHDWGGIYTDQQVRDANATFLNNVIPRLESRSYVAGYAWYNWFGDSTLVEGNPLTPTNVGVPYVGTITSGNVYNFAGVDLGQHVAYLTGGELTLIGRLLGTVRYINALSGVSTISGGPNWGLSATNWVRVQTGATLRKMARTRSPGPASTSPTTGSSRWPRGICVWLRTQSSPGRGSGASMRVGCSACTAKWVARASFSPNPSSSAAARSAPMPSATGLPVAAPSTTRPPSLAMEISS